MKWRRGASAAAAAAVLLTPAAAAAAASETLDCENIQVDGQSFNLKELAGPHSVVTSRHTSPTWTNTTYTLNVCGPLKRKGDVNKEEACPDGTRVCAIRHVLSGDHDTVSEVIPIAGELAEHEGHAFEWEATRLHSSDADSDTEKQGLRLVLKGGVHEGHDQRAVVDLVCDKDQTGLEDEWVPEEKYEPKSKGRRRQLLRTRDGADEDGGHKGEADPPHAEGEFQLIKENAPLVWNSYGPAKEGSDVNVLQLTWKTKFACASASEGGGSGGSGKSGDHWGFFTWFIVIVFLATATYLIFGAWLNYNRYGARGWDLLPHGDSLRDVPYLLKDWTRRVLNTVQGSGSRGGYSAL